MRIFIIFTLMTYCHLLNAFSVTVSKDLHVVDYGGNVTMECTFPVGEKLNLDVLVVYWEMGDKKIIQFVNGKEDPKVQHNSYSQRAQLLKDQLSQGKAMLQITDVKLRDAGVYFCLISYGGADYKRITLKVNAPYRRINQRISVDHITLEHELTCQAKGYPEAEVIWTSRDHHVLKGKTIITKEKEEELFNVTSMLRVNASAQEIFYCTFRRAGIEENTTAELVIPEQVGPPVPSRRTHLLLLGFIPVCLIILIAVIFSQKRNVRRKDVEKGDVGDLHTKIQNDTKFEET